MARFCTVLSISSNLLKYNIRSSFIILITLRAHCHQALKHIALMGQRGMRRTNYSPLYHFLPLYHSKHTAQLRKGLFTYYVSQNQGFLDPPSPLRRQWSAPIPTSTNHNTTQKVNIFVKTKNVPKGPKMQNKP